MRGFSILNGQNFNSNIASEVLQAVLAPRILWLHVCLLGSEHSTHLALCMPPLLSTNLTTAA